MKKLILMTIFSVFSISMCGQVMIGYSENQIKNHFADSQYVMSIENDEFGRMIMIDSPKSEVTYFIGNDGKCDGQIVQPKDTKTLKEFIEMYNKDFIVKSDWQWKAYLDVGIFDVELRRLEGGGHIPFFTWNRAN